MPEDSRVSSLSSEQRLAVVDEAKAWVAARTPYMPHAKLKGLGCDCATFILCVYRDLGLMEDTELGAYSIQAHLHKPISADAWRKAGLSESEAGKTAEAHERLLTQYVDTILRYADEITEAEVQPGDMVLFKTARAFAHGAIVIDWPTVAHAAIGQGVVFADVSIDPHLQRRERRFFRRNFSKG
jgi:cell wall-associated NlpC family hydrolase